MDKTIANIILYDNGKRILLQHRTDDAPTFPGEYGIFGGSIEPGEDPLSAVKRECLEELEYVLEKPKFLWEINCECKYGKRHKYVYEEMYNPAQKLMLHEGQGMIWIGKSDLHTIKIIDHDFEVLKKYFSLPYSFN